MNFRSLLLSRSGRYAAALVLAGALSFSVAHGQSGDKGGNPKPVVVVDDKPLERSGDGTSYSPVIKQVAPSVVKVRVAERAKREVVSELPGFFNDPRLREFFGPFGGGDRRVLRQPPQEGLGSGVVVTADGYILTNNHVVQGADSIKISFNDGRELTAKVVGTDPKSDLAVIKVDAKDLKHITFADSEKIEVGDRVLAIGNPFGIGQTVTSGMVSGLGRATMGLEYEDFIQTDAAINPGNSGGALIDVKGRLIGINTAILSRSGGFQGIGFAIPSNMARGIMEQLVTKGKVVRGFIGVSAQEISADLAETFKLPSSEGVIVAEVVDRSPADKAGLQRDDVIVKFDGRPIKGLKQFRLTVAGVQPGTKVKLDVIREGKNKELEVTVGDLAKDQRRNRVGSNDRDGDRYNERPSDEGTLNGVMVGDLNAASRREFDVPSRIKGALVTDVDPSSASAAAGLQPGDVILEINRQAVYSADDAVKLTENPDSRKTVLRVWNQGGTRYVVVDETDESPASEP